MKMSKISVESSQRRPSCQAEKNSAASSKEDMTVVQLAVLGAPAVGKTAIVSLFAHQQIPVKYQPTVENFYWIEYELLKVNHSKLMLNIIDASGSNDFKSMRDLYILQADAFLLVFAINDPKSIEEVKNLIEDVKKTNPKKAPIIIVANKVDLKETADSRLTMSKAVELADTEDIMLAECSVDDYTSVLDVFNRLMKQLPGVTDGLDLVNKRRRQSMPIGHWAVDQHNKKCQAKKKCVIS